MNKKYQQPQLNKLLSWKIFLRNSFLNRPSSLPNTNNMKDGPPDHPAPRWPKPKLSVFYGYIWKLLTKWTLKVLITKEKWDTSFLSFNPGNYIRWWRLTKVSMIIIFSMYESQIIVLDTLNTYREICQLYIIKTERKKIFRVIKEMCLFWGKNNNTKLNLKFLIFQKSDLHMHALFIAKEPSNVKPNM